ncbi:MAG: precorrin-8X methylmutase [Eubacteriales bacterium]|nr:precorrin-8X methylmutase [Eubacteriales bacterium]
MIKRPTDGNRHRIGIPYMNQEMTAILANVEADLGDHALAQSVYFSPTALTHIKRLIDQGGSIITDTTLVANDIDKSLLGAKGAQVRCFIDDPQVDSLAEQRRVTRAEIAVDYGLTTPGLKLMVVGSAPAAINRLIARRQHEPMSDVCVLAAPSGFASVVQLKERLLDSDLTSIIVRGKKGGIPATISIVNAILREISKGN